MPRLARARAATDGAVGPIRLVAFLDGRTVGAVHRESRGAARFIYYDDWRLDPEAYPVSLSMPLASRAHGPGVITPFLWGLLPDNERTLAQYGRQFGVSPRNPIDLLAHIGADCAGAIQFASPEHAAALAGSAPRTPTVDWLTETEVARELRTVREHGIPGTTPRTIGQFSLAGAQPKIALLHDGRRWGLPRGRTPTTHILKPPTREFAGFAENEHFCLDLAARLGLGAASSRVTRFDTEVAIVVQRFDRVKRDGVYRRLHQEDACQALGVMPNLKYENQGGPGIADIVTLLRATSHAAVDDVGRFLGAVALGWVIAATDGHAKNYALLHGAGQRVRLAPLFDIASYLPYTDRALHRVKLAMQVGGEYLIRRVARPHWIDLADRIAVPPHQLLDEVRALLTRLPDAIEDTRAAAVRDGLNAKFVNGLAQRLVRRTDDCVRSVVASSAG